MDTRSDRYRGLGLCLTLLASIAGCGGGEAVRDAALAPDAGGDCAGAEGCACRAAGLACNAGLACVAGTCGVCAEGAAECACRFSDPQCDDGLVCTSGSCAACEPGTSGCPCGAGDTCEGDALCVDGACRAPSCDALRATGDCVAERECADSASGPLCGACLDGYCEAEGGACTAAPPEGCDPPSCDPDDPGSIADLCASQSRTCEGDVGTASCGACLDGFLDNPVTGACDSSCGGVDCTAAEMPEWDALGACTCVGRVCAATEAQLPDGSCRTCTIRCTDSSGDPLAGSTGSVHGETDALGNCLCETAADYYWHLGDRAAAPCDEDADGWVNASAFDAIGSSDDAIRLNARCALQQADRVRLINEYGQSETVWSCTGSGLVRADMNPCTSGAPIALVESDRNDSQDKIDDSTTPPGGGPPATPAYRSGTMGRALRAAELNGLTRACVAATADFDDDGFYDVEQTQRNPMLVATNRERLQGLTYFLELYESRFEAGTAGLGSLVIEERSRCDGAFPMGYGVSAGAWWSECHRQRDARFDASALLPGLDFAQWSCDVSSGACPVPRPPGMPASGASTPPPHGLCELMGTWSAEPWRGMHHHSQFQCVLVGNSGAAHERPVADFDATSGHLTFNACRLDAADLSCAAGGSPALGAVGWAAVRYVPTVTLGGSPVPDVIGCVDESVWDDLCPPPATGTAPYVGADDANFGRLVCGCGGMEAPYYQDADGDGYGDPGALLRACVHPGLGYVDNADDCDDSEPAVSPVAPLDLPDVDMVDADCDGLDGDLDATDPSERLVFVSAVSGSDDPSGLGTAAAPVRTIARALELWAFGYHGIVLDDSGVYAGPVTLRDGVAIYGGYRWDGAGTSAWRRDLSHVTTIQSTAVDTTRRAIVAVNAIGLTSSTLMQHVTVRAGVVGTPPAVEGVTTYGVRAVDSPGLFLDHVTVVASEGSPGAVGAAGASGLRGGNARVEDRGVNATGSMVGGCADRHGQQGVFGGENTCGGGLRGQSGCNGPGGAAGGDPGSNGGQCGLAPANGTDGAAATSVGGVTGEAYWLPMSGADGTRGGTGRPGSSGGGGGGRYACPACNSTLAGRGGGGGAGGCGGLGGAGGQGGGGSFALFAVRSPGLAYRAASFRAGDGAGGAVGGLAGSGGPGGAAGAGQAAVCRGGQGGNGGGGGAGAAGGRGGPGAGGVSYAIYACEGSVTDRDPTEPSTTTYGVAGDGAPGWDGSPNARAGDARATLDQVTCPGVP